MREHAHKMKVAKSARKKQQKAVAKESTSAAQQQPQQQQEKHVLYFEKRARPTKKAPALRPFVPPKKNQKNSCDAIGQSNSQTSSQPDSLVPPKKKSSQTIPMSQVVTEQVPKYGRMKWLLGEKQKQGQDGQE